MPVRLTFAFSGLLHALSASHLSCACLCRSPIAYLSLPLRLSPLTRIHAPHSPIPSLLPFSFSLPPPPQGTSVSLIGIGAQAHNNIISKH